MTLKAVSQVQPATTPTIRATNSAALMPMLAGSLAQLQPTMQKTQESVQALVEKMTRALEESEKRSGALVAELAAEKAAREADKVTFIAALDSMKELNKTVTDREAVLVSRISALEDQTKYIRPTIKAMIAYGAKAFIELDYPGKKEDLALRKPVLQAELAALKLEINQSGVSGSYRQLRRGPISSLEAEAARIAAWEAREAKAKE